MKADPVVFLLPSLKSGGGNRVVIELSNQLVQLGVDVYIVYPNNSADSCPYYIGELVNLICIGKLASSNARKLLNLREVFSYVNRNFSKYKNVVLFTDPIMSMFSFCVSSKHKIRFLQANDYCIFDDLFVLKKKYFLFFYKLLTSVSYRLFSISYIFNSKYTYDSFIGVRGGSYVDFNLVHPAINHDVFHKVDCISSKEKPNIGIVARKHPLKGFSDFLLALKSIDKSLYSDVFVISHDDLSAFDLTGCSLVQPSSDIEMASTLNNIDIFVSTSWEEGFGLPPLEAMACNCAVIVTSCGGVAEYAVDQKNCLMYEPRNVEQLLNCLDRLLNDTNLVQRICSEGVETSRKFSWSKSAVDFIDIIAKE